MKNILFIIILTLSSSCVELNVSLPSDSTDSSSNHNEDITNTHSDTPLSERSTGMLHIESGYCGCKNGVPITLGNCSNFCANNQHESNNESILFFEVQENDELRYSYLKDLYGFCSIDSSEATNPYCVIEVQDANGTVGHLSFMPSVNDILQSVNIGNLESEKTYSLKVKEVASGVSSSVIQIRLFDLNL